MTKNQELEIKNTNFHQQKGDDNVANENKTIFYNSINKTTNI